MLDFSNFIVRHSGRGPETYYIDCCGLYRVGDIAHAAGVKNERLLKIYQSNNGEYNADLDIYYFGSLETAKKAISEIFLVIKDKNKGRSIFLTEQEIQYLRKAVINNASGFAGFDSRLSDAILKKLNG